MFILMQCMEINMNIVRMVCQWTVRLMNGSGCITIPLINSIEECSDTAILTLNVLKKVLI